jgi:hypothetical protein
MKGGPGAPSTRRWLRRSLLLSVILLLPIMVSFTVWLIYNAIIADPIRIADVTAQPTFQDPSIGNLDVHATGRLEQGLVPVAVSGSISDPSVSGLTLITGPPGSAVLSQQQKGCCTISDMTFVGTAQLGTAHSPLTRTSVVPFRLVSSDGNTLEAAGSLAVNVESFPGGSPLAYQIIGVLSILATVIAVGQSGIAIGQGVLLPKRQDSGVVPAERQGQGVLPPKREKRRSHEQKT